MQLKRLELTHFCGFTEFSVDFDNFNVLIGPNNGGKSTILRAIRFVSSVVYEKYGKTNDIAAKLTADAQIAKGYRDRMKQTSEQLSRRYPGGAKAQGNPIQQVEEEYRRATAVNFSDVADSLVSPNPTLTCFGKDATKLSSLRLVFDDLEGAPADVSVQHRADKSHVTIEVKVGDSGIEDMAIEEAEVFVRCLLQLSATLLPPSNDIRAQESLQDWKQFQTHLKKSGHREVWRNSIQWLNEGKDPECFLRVIDRIRQYMSDVSLRPPKRSREGSLVELNYAQEGTELDIITSGGGLRTLVMLVSHVELSETRLLLLDEPDAHLHSSLQRGLARYLEEASATRQVIIASHAPDLIEELPVDSVIWIDRHNGEGRRLDDVGKALIDLGAVSHTQALNSIGADVILYFEDVPDRTALVDLLKRCGKDGLATRARVATLGGFGDASKLPGALSILKALRNTKLAMAAILDADYVNASPEGTAEEDNGVLLIHLPCKELENLLVLSCDAIAKAASEAAQKRSAYTGKGEPAPASADIERKIDHVTADEEIKKNLRPHWIQRWALQENVDLNGDGNVKRGETQFEDRWKNAEWRRRYCSGKAVLKRIRAWLQQEYKLTLSNSLLFKHYVPDQNLKGLFDRLEEHVKRELEDE